MKKLIVILSILLIAVLLVGCGTPKEKIVPTTSDNKEGAILAEETPIDKDIASLDSGTSDDLTSIDSGLDDIGKDLDAL